MEIGDKTNWIKSLAIKDRISFYSSQNLLEWTHESEFNPDWAAYGGVWECPDLFPLQTPDGEQKWVLFVSINPGGPNGGSATQYFIGDFSVTFENEFGESLVIGKRVEELFIDRTKSGLTDFNEGFASIMKAPLNALKINKVRILLDRSSVEVFINDGALVMTALVFPEHIYSTLLLNGFEAENKLYSLKKIW